MDLEFVNGLEIKSGDRPGSVKSQVPIAPGRIMLLPSGGVLNGSDGRSWVNAPEDVVASFGNPIPVDIGHSTHSGAPALGWIESVQVVDGAVWGSVKWLPDGAALVAAQRYRFISPAIESANGKVTKIISAGLTNEPNFGALPALNHRSGGVMSDPLPILSGVAESAASDGPVDQSAQLTAIKRRLNLAPSATLDDVLSCLPGLEPASSVKPADANQGQLASGMSELLVDAWIQAGRVAPAQRQQAIQMASLDPVVFGAYVAAMPQLVSAGTTVTQELVKPVAKMPDYLLRAGISADAYRLGSQHET